MAKIYCYRDDCVYRSNRASKMKNGAGQPLYLCKKGIIVLSTGDSWLDREEDELNENGDVVCCQFEHI